jgi:hypothetical protein
MRMMPRRILVFLVVLALVPGRSQGCSFCESNVQLSLTFRQEAALMTARVILHGTIANPRLGADGTRGQTDFLIKTVLRSDPAIKGKKTLVLPRYLPFDKGETPHYLLFCDIDKDKIDPYRGVRIKGETTADYVKKALLLNGKDSVGNLLFFFRYLDDADPEVARDAFLEFAKATDADIARAAPKLSADKLRAWIKEPKTPGNRLGVYAMLLGACGKAADAAWLRELLANKEERYQAAADGLLAGYLHLEPKKGWALAQDILADGRKSLPLRLAVLRTLRFYHGSQPKESKPQILRAMKTLLVQGELADLAVEDLRRWQVWDLTSDVLKLYGQKGFDAPLMKRAILRYALCCKTSKEAGDFVKQRKSAEGDLVKEVEEGLQFEKAM